MKLLAEIFLMPSGLITLLVVMAVVLFLVLKRHRAAVYVGMAAALVYVVFGSGVVANALIGHLEHEFAPAQDVEGSVSPDTMVVLTGYAFSDSRIPITGHVNSSSGFRLIEGARIFMRTRRMNVIISGNGEVPAIMRNLLAELGVPHKKIALDQGSASTYESAVNLRSQLAGKQFYLVTSAGHMPRAMRVFRSQGQKPIPAPTDYLSSAVLREISYLPSGKYLAVSDLAIHEYIGLAWYRMFGRI